MNVVQSGHGGFIFEDLFKDVETISVKVHFPDIELLSYTYNEQMLHCPVRTLAGNLAGTFVLYYRATLHPDPTEIIFGQFGLYKSKEPFDGSQKGMIEAMNKLLVENGFYWEDYTGLRSNYEKFNIL